MLKQVQHDIIEKYAQNHYNNKDIIDIFLLSGETSVLKKSGYTWF